MFLEDIDWNWYIKLSTVCIINYIVDNICQWQARRVCNMVIMVWYFTQGGWRSKCNYVESRVYAHRARPSVLVQDIRISNPSVSMWRILCLTVFFYFLLFMYSYNIIHNNLWLNTTMYNCHYFLISTYLNVIQYLSETCYFIGLIKR